MKSIFIKYIFYNKIGKLALESFIKISELVFFVICIISGHFMNLRSFLYKEILKEYVKTSFSF